MNFEKKAVFFSFMRGNAKIVLPVCNFGMVFLTKTCACRSPQICTDFLRNCFDFFVKVCANLWQLPTLVKDPESPRTDFFIFQTKFCMKLILILPAAGLLFSGAMRPDKMPTKLPIQTQSLAVESAPAMWSDSPLLFKGEDLTLHFKTPHPQYLGVIDPDGHFFYVVFPKENSAGKLKPLLDSKLFETMKTLTISTEKFSADPYTYGVLENKPVFTKSGTYRFLLGDNLHVDDENALTILKVNYHHMVRPRPQTAIAAI